MPTAPSATSQHLGGRYEARQNEDGTIDLFDVPIVGELEAGEREDLPDFSIDESWLQAALGRAQERAKEGYIPPLHIRHHGSDAVAPRAGFFMPTRLGDFTLGGKPTKTLFANLLRLSKDVAAKVMRGELPYCSVEVLNTSRSPEIDSLALLDSEPPQFRYPLITVGRMTKAGAAQQPVTMRKAPAGTQAVAFIALPKQHAAAALFRYARKVAPKRGAKMSLEDAPIIEDAPADDMPPWAAKLAQMITEGIDASLTRHFQAEKDASVEDELPADLRAAKADGEGTIKINTDDDPEAEIEIDLDEEDGMPLDAAKKIKAAYNPPDEEICKKCKGVGEVKGQECQQCRGTGAAGAALASKKDDDSLDAAADDDEDGKKKIKAAADDEPKKKKFPEPKPKAPAQASAGRHEPAVPRFVDPTLGEKDARLAAKVYGAVSRRIAAEQAESRGEIAGLKAKLKARDARDAKKARVEKAKAELRGVNLDDDSLTDLEFNAGISQEATDRFVATAKRAFGRDPGRFDDLVSDISDDPPEVATFAAKGHEALSMARKVYKHYEENRSKGLVTMTLERYLACNTAEVETRPAARFTGSRN